MATTSLTLLDRLRRPDQPDAWERFARLYAPLLLCWAELQGLHAADAEDLAQAVLLKLLRVLPSYDPAGGSFRGWLFAVCRNECHDFRTRRDTRPLPAAAGLETVAAPTRPDELEEAEYRRRLVRRVLELVRPDFGESTWRAFEGFVMSGRPAAEVAAEVGVSVNAVYCARNRVLTRVRAELAGLFE